MSSSTMSRPPETPKTVRYRFGEFTLSPRQRVLARGGVAVALIPKYFDLLHLLIERRADALDRREIFDRIWADVVVSDGALSQAVRTLRRILQDDPRSPRYIRTVSRHGYQFVFEPVLTEDDEAVPERGRSRDVQPAHVAPAPVDVQYATLMARLLGSGPHGDLSEDERREAAEQLHVLGTRAALEHLDARPGHARARALLRDARWDVPSAGEVPLLAAPDPIASVVALIALRVRRAARSATSRLGTASAAGAIAGLIGGAVGGVALMLPGRSQADAGTLGALVIIGGTAGAFGAAGVGGGLAAAEALARSRRRLALALCGALSGMIAGALAHAAVTVVFGSVVGRPPAALGGPLEGLLIGLAAGIGYGWSTPTPRGGGMATPRGKARLATALATALCCAIGGAALSGMGAKTVSATLDTLGETYTGSRVGLEALAGMIGEQQHRPITRSLVGGFEGLLFGFGLAFGLTHRPSGSSSR
jgi:DNA-binding winged helix-turn-helix (wHTH) protein